MNHQQHSELPGPASETPEYCNNDQERPKKSLLKRKLKESRHGSQPKRPRSDALGHQQHSEPPGPASETPEYCNNVQERHKKKRARNTTEKNEAAKLKHNILKSCGSQCRRKCCSKISEEQCVSVHKAFWDMDFNRRRTWLSGHIKTLPVKKVMSERNKHRLRTCHNIFVLPDTSGNAVTVCQKFFLTTLGYSSNRVILELTGNIRTHVVPMPDKRGKKTPPNKKDDNQIRSHIELYHPLSSHYRREHAPNRRYITNEVTLKDMFADFVAKYGEIVSYETYRKCFKAMNISFAVPEVDKCDDCAYFQHNTESDDIQTAYVEHKQRAREARHLYRADLDGSWPEDTAVFAVDLQKIMLLPRMPDYKKCIFTSRLVVFNETFASVVSAHAADKTKHYLALWNESISGRCSADITSAFHKIIALERDRSHFVFWLDNCSSQNKNWFFFSMLVVLVMVNQSYGPQTIILRYFVPGHTHMAADGVQGNIEKAIRRRKNIYDMQDLSDVMSKSLSNVSVVNMSVTDFRDWPNLCKARTQRNGLPLFKEIVEAKFVKGDNKLFYKTNFADDYLECDLLKAKAKNKLSVPASKVTDRGLQASKKAKIVKDLVPMMPANRRAFWESLPESSDSINLLGSSASD